MTPQIHPWHRTDSPICSCPVCSQMTPQMQRTLADPAASDWLKAAILSLIKRDACDAVADAKYLAKLFDARLDAMLGLKPTNRS